MSTCRCQLFVYLHFWAESERYYWKDGECPSQWKDWLQRVLPAPILPGSRDDLLRHLLPSVCFLNLFHSLASAHPLLRFSRNPWRPYFAISA